MLTTAKQIENQVTRHTTTKGSFFGDGRSMPFFQPKLTVNTPGDAHEQEADRVADQVMRMPAFQPSAGKRNNDAPIVMRMPLTTVSGIQRSCAGCEEEQQAQRKETNGGDASGKAAPSIVSDVLSSGGGQAMDGGTRQFMESRFGQDFSSVRIHTGSRAAESAGAIQAKAYTSGRDVVFGAGEYQPGSESGRRLLAHELVHVGQQGGGVQRMVIPRNVTCHQTGLRNPDLTGPEVVEQIDFADAIAISMLQSAEDDLAAQLNNVGGGGVPDVAINQILTEELDLDLNTPAHLPLIQQVVGRINRVRTTMESGYLRYMCRGGSNVSLVGCASAACEEGDFAFTCPGNRLIVLCQGFWDNVAERPGTILHEVFHIWFDMDHGNRTKRANATCLEGFVRRINGLGAGDFSCAGGVP